MAEQALKPQLPPIPAKRYFTIGEVSELCGVKPHVLRYWEQEFTQLKPVKRRGNRRDYQHHEVLLIRRIRELLYDEGFTISGARNRLEDQATQSDVAPHIDVSDPKTTKSETVDHGQQLQGMPFDIQNLKQELQAVLKILSI
jgi:DNA-binding transcriptional MerR regulator